MRVLTHGQIREINGCERLKCHGLLVYLKEVVFGNSPSDHET